MSPGEKKSLIRSRASRKMGGQTLKVKGGEGKKRTGRVNSSCNKHASHETRQDEGKKHLGALSTPAVLVGFLRPGEGKEEKRKGNQDECERFG